jgi:ribosomal protein S19
VGESTILADIRQSLGMEPNVRMFRNNVSLAWAGRDATRATSPQVVRLNTGDVVIRNARPLHAGLAVGSADLIGIERVTITPEMVGQTIGRFVSLETKSAIGRASTEQKSWARMVAEFGGLSAVVRSVDEARRVLGL